MALEAGEFRVVDVVETRQEFLVAALVKAQPVHLRPVAGRG